MMNGIVGRAQPPTKTIVVYRNGDHFFPGRKMVVNQRQLSTFDSFLTFLTVGIEAPFGAVRNVYTPREGHRIASLDSLKHGERYVAAGAERFKKLDYYQITNNKPKTKKSEQILPVVHSKILVPARWKRIINKSCIINVFTNGDITIPPARILIPKCNLRSWENVLAMVTEKVHLRTGAVYRLYTLDGYPLRCPAELNNNQYYVASGASKFRALPYHHWVPSSKGSSCDSQGDQGSGTGTDNRKTQETKGDTVTAMRKIQLVNGNALVHTDLRGDLEHTARGPTRNHTDSARAERAKQQKQVSRIPLLLTAGLEDTRRVTFGAAEVPDDPHIKVDLPIDQVEANTVEEEFERDCSPSPDAHRELLQDADGGWQQRPRSDGREKDCHLFSGPEMMGGDSCLTAVSPTNGQRKSHEPEEAKTTAASPAARGIRSRLSRFFKGRVIKA